jgi:FimV-like protein
VLAAPVAAEDTGQTRTARALDELWRRGAEPAAIHSLVESTPPLNYHVAWRAARAFDSLARRATTAEARRQLAATGMSYAQAAIDRDANRVEGHYYLAACVGHYGASIGSVQAVVQGIAAKFEHAALTAYALDRHFDHGGPMIALGRYYHQLPWPKRDLAASCRYLEEAVAAHPASLVGRVYLAETYRDLGDDERAPEQLAAVLTAGPDPAQETAREHLQRWFGAEQLAALGGDGDAPGAP